MRQREAVAVYTYMRASELEALDADAVDVHRRVIHIHQAMVRGALKELKGRYARRIPIDPGILPVLKAVLKRRPKGRVFDFDSDRKLARKLRAQMRIAGIEREELYGTTATRKQMTWHD